MISRNYGGVELGYFFKRNFSLSTRNSRITTTRREIPATASPTFTRPFLSPLLPFLLLFPAKRTRNPSSFSPFLRKETSSTPIAPLDELLLIYRVPVLRLKLRVFFFFFFLLTQWSRIEKIFSASFSLPRMNVSIVFRAHVQLWGIPSYFVSIFALFLASSFSPFNSPRSTVFYDPFLYDSGWMGRIYPPSLTFIQWKGRLLFEFFRIIQQKL